MAPPTRSLELVNAALNGVVVDSTKKAVRSELPPDRSTGDRRRPRVLVAGSRRSTSRRLGTGRRPGAGLQASPVDHVLAVVAQSVLGDLRRVIVAGRVPLTRHRNFCSVQSNRHALSSTSID